MAVVLAALPSLIARLTPAKCPFEGPSIARAHLSTATTTTTTTKEILNARHGSS